MSYLKYVGKITSEGQTIHVCKEDGGNIFLGSDKQLIFPTKLDKNRSECIQEAKEGDEVDLMEWTIGLSKDAFLKLSNLLNREPKRNPGRPKGKGLTTGRFDTREKLVERILFLDEDTTCSAARIARNTKVSESTVANILKEKK